MLSFAAGFTLVSGIARERLGVGTSSFNWPLTRKGTKSKEGWSIAARPVAGHQPSVMNDWRLAISVREPSPC